MVKGRYSNHPTQKLTINQNQRQIATPDIFQVALVGGQATSKVPLGRMTAIYSAEISGQFGFVTSNHHSSDTTWGPNKICILIQWLCTTVRGEMNPSEGLIHNFGRIMEKQKQHLSLHRQPQEFGWTQNHIHFMFY